MPDEQRLSEADIDAIVSALEARLQKRFFENVGKGVWGVAWRGLVIILLAAAAYGAALGGGDGAAK